jgi:hypothetical protein
MRNVPHFSTYVNVYEVNLNTQIKEQLSVLKNVDVI